MERPQVNQRKEHKEVATINRTQSAARKRLEEWLKRSGELLEEDSDR